jgi:hypothetical protein
MKIEIIKAIESEREYQEKKWPLHKHTTAEWILIMDKCMADAKKAWVCGHGDTQALHEIRQVVAVGVAAMEQCGALPRGTPIINTERCSQCHYPTDHCQCQHN